MLAVLLDHDPNVRNDLEWTPLHSWAVFGTQPESLELLVERERRWMKTTPLHLAAALTHQGLTPLLLAAAHSELPERIEALLVLGADLDARGYSGTTALHLAAALNPEPAMVEFLLERGLDLEAEGDDALTPLHWSVLVDGKLAVVTALLDHGAKSTRVPSKNSHPCMWRSYTRRIQKWSN